SSKASVRHSARRSGMTCRKPIWPPILLLMNAFSKIALPILLAIMLTGCGSSLNFEDGDAAVVLEANPVQLSGEQVLLNDEQVACGDREELWHLTQLGGGHAVGKLTEKGRALQFSDDVRVGTAGAAGPTVQVSGKF